MIWSTKTLHFMKQLIINKLKKHEKHNKITKKEFLGVVKLTAHIFFVWGLMCFRFGVSWLCLSRVWCVLGLPCLGLWMAPKIILFVEKQLHSLIRQDNWYYLPVSLSSIIIGWSIILIFLDYLKQKCVLFIAFHKTTPSSNI